MVSKGKFSRRDKDKGLSTDMAATNNNRKKKPLDMSQQTKLASVSCDDIGKVNKLQGRDIFWQPGHANRPQNRSTSTEAQESDYGFLPFRQRHRSDLDHSQSNTPHTAAYARRVGDLREVDLDRSQDDSLVFIESPSKKSGTKLKNQRRGESFNLKNTGPAWGSPESKEATPTSTKRKWSFKRFGFTKRSVSSDQTSKEPTTADHTHGDSQQIHGGSAELNSQFIGSHSSVGSSSDSHMVQSTPSLHQYSMNSEVSMVAGSPGNMAHSQTWQGQDLTSKSSSDFGYTQSNGELTESNGYSDNTSVGKENRVPPGYKSLLEYKVSQINKSYSTSAIPASSTSKSNRRSNNYDPVNSYLYTPDQNNDTSSYLSPRSNSVSSPHTPKENVTAQRYDSDNNHASSLPPQIFQDEMPQKSFLGQGQQEGHSSKHKGHSKNPSWPVDVGQAGSVSEDSPVSGSWSDINAASPGPRTGKPVKTFFHPSLNPHLEEKINPKDVRRQLEEHRLRSPKEPPTRQPMVAKADSETGRAFVYGSEIMEQLEISNKGSGTSVHGSADGSSSVPPLSPSSSVATKDSSVLNEVSWNVVNTPSAGYMYIVRQKPCYNTSTQTDTPKPEPSDSLKSPSDSVLTGTASSGSKNHAKILVTEDRAIQARPGSIVAASMPSGMKSVAVGNDQDYDNLEQWEQSSLQSPTKSSNLVSEITEGKSEKQHRDVKPKSPKNSSVSSPKPYYLGDDDIAKIKEQSSDSAMLRKLSQEYFMQRNPGQRLSANMDEDQSGRKLSFAEEKPPDSPRRLRANDRALESKVSRTTKNALIEMRKDIEYYEMQEHINKSQTKGPFDPVDCNDNHKTDRKTGLSQGGSYMGAFGVSSSGQKSKDSKRDTNTEVSQTGNQNPDTANMDTHSIAEQARKEWIHSGMFHKYGGPKALKRTVSEQIRPSKELYKGIGNQLQVNHVPSDTGNDKKHKISDPGTAKAKIEHSYQTSDPTANYQSYMTHENRLSSDGETLLQKRHDRNQRPGSNVSNRSSSSGSTGADDKNRISDPDLKRLQQKAVLNFFELKTGKRLSSSSIDSNAGVDMTTPKGDKSQDSWHQQKSTSQFKSSEDRTTPVKKSLTSPDSLTTLTSSNKRRASAGANLAPRRSTKDSVSGPEVSPPPLLDTSTTPGMRSQHSYSSSATSTSFSPTDPHSPPLHPWPMDLNKGIFPTEPEPNEHNMAMDDGTINSRASSHGNRDQDDFHDDDDLTELKRRIQQSGIEPEKLDQTALKALQYSTSSADESPAGHSLSSDPRFSYQVTGGSNKVQPDPGDDEVAPALPPRNYRNNLVPESSRGQMPEPMEPPREPKNDNKRLSANTEQQQQQMMRSSSSSSYTDVFTSDYDATPARDMYADQLRQSARRISQSHINPYLNAARYQSKPVAELKPSVATSRPVDKPALGTTSEPLHSSVISSSSSSSSNNNTTTANNKDYSGLSSPEGGEPSPTHRRGHSSSNNFHQLPSPKTPHQQQQHSPNERNSSTNNVVTTPVHYGPHHQKHHHQSERDSDSYGRIIHHSPQGSGSSDHGVYLTPVSSSTTTVHSKGVVGSSPSSNFSNSDLTVPSTNSHRGSQNPTKRVDSAHISPNSDNLNPSGRRSRHDSSSDLDDLPPPPPLPPHHHHSPSNSRLEEKPLPPLPGSEADAQDRFSGESYISNKSNYRQAYGGNYRRGAAELSPKSPSSITTYSPRESNHSTSTHPPVGETMVTVTKLVTVNKYPGEASNPQTPQMQSKHKSPAAVPGSGGGGPLPWERKSSVGEAVPWSPKSKSYAPVQPFGSGGNISKHKVEGSSSLSGGSEESLQQTNTATESPSVKSVIANIEQRGKPDKSTPKGKFANLKDTLDRRVYDRENVSTTTGQKTRGQDVSHSSHSSAHSLNQLEARLPSHSSLSSTEDITTTSTSSSNTPRGEAKLYKRDNNKGYSHSHTKSDPLRTDRLEFSPMTRTRSVESENLQFTQRTSEALQKGSNSSSSNVMDSADKTSSEELNNYSCEARETVPPQQSMMNSFEISQISHSRERSDPQSDGDTRSNDSGVAEDMTHSRQKSQEEIECEKQAALVASHLQDKQLSQVILPPPEHKTTTDYVSGLFDTRINTSRKPSLRNTATTRVQLESLRKSSEKIEDSTPTKSPSSRTDLPANSPYWSPPSLANLQNKMRQEGVQADDILGSGENVSLDTEKDELIVRIEKKLEILREEKTLLELEIKENEALGKELGEVVSQKVQNKAEYNKYQLYVTELDKVMILLLKLSGRLARAENAVSSLPEDAAQNERSPLLAKRDELLEKLDDAKALKEGIDRRSKQVSVILKKQLTEAEYEDYEYFIKLKSKLTMDQQEITDKLKLGEEQLSALRKSMNQSDC